jgi:hypothetical protein
VPTPADLKRLADSFDWDKWSAKVRSAIEDDYRAIALEQGQREADAYDLDFDAEDPFVDHFFTEYLGERITQIDETTRDRVRGELQSALADGNADSVQDLAERLRTAVGDSAAFSPSRALTIARTETAFAVGHGAGLAYRQNGITHVEISDGDDDEDCAEADGEIWTVDEYLAEPIAHPNCVRSASPVLDDEDPSDDEE